MRSSSLPASAKQLFAVATSIALLSSSLFPSLAHASSSTRNPIAALTPLQQPRILTNQGRVTALHSDFDLTFGLNDQVDVRLRLEPNHDILADDTHVSYLAADGSITHSENIDRSAHKVFKGTAWVRKANHPEEDGDDAQDRTQPQWQRAGWARVSIFRDGKHPVFQGAFSVDRDHHHIQTATGYMRTRHAEDPIVDVDGLDEYMVLWRDSDILPDFADHRDLKRSADAAPACGADELSFNTQEDHPVYAAMKSKRSEDLYGSMDFSRLFARQIDGVTGGNSAGGNLLASIGKTAGCPTTRKVALVGVAMDCTYTADFNSTQSARENVIDQMNTASGVWENAFNISLGLQNVTVSDANCPGTPNSATAWNQACSDNVDIQARLNLFSAWRGEQQDNNSHWTLLSTCATQSAVGLAWLGQACVHNSMSTNGSVTGEGQSGSGEDVVAGANVVVRTQGASEWQIIAHETGHTFGAVHDCTDQSCANPNVVNAQQCCPLSSSVCDAGERYIMNPQSSQGIREFSPCSIGNVCSALGRNSVKGDCLTDNRGIKTFTGQQCGNGIVEAGEDCDCGGETGCKNDPCCNPTTCKFTQGSVCDDANEDCCRQCQFASAGTVCRASTSECDPEETCPGDSASCPVDKNKEDGSSCGKGLQCSSGQCTSRDQQCKTVSEPELCPCACIC
jgi:hypothetical protein